MRERSDLWKQIVEGNRFELDVKAVINGTEYTSISAVTIDQAACEDSLTVGNVAIASMQMTVKTSDVIPTAAEVIIKARVREGSTVSEWLDFGAFYIDERSVVEDMITLTGYDALLKSEAAYPMIITDPEGSEAYQGIPKPMVDCVYVILDELGLELDERSVIREGNGYYIRAPEQYTMRQVLGFIAAANGGNWILTPEGKLRLVPFMSAPGETYYINDENGDRLMTPNGIRLVWRTPDVPLLADIVDVPVVIGGAATTSTVNISRVTMVGEDEDTESYTNGDDSGFDLRIEAGPVASPNVCRELYARLNGLVHTTFEATNVCYDPAAEIGDGMFIGNIARGILYTQHLVLGRDFRADISAPDTGEIRSEYPYLSPVKQTLASIKLSARANDETGGIVIRLNNGKKVSEVGLELSVQNNGASSDITITAGGIQMASQRIQFDGLVTFAGLEDGTTEINGGCIRTGLINADHVQLRGAGGGFCNATGEDGSGSTYGAMMYGKDPRYYFIATDRGVRMEANGVSFYATSNRIVSSVPISEPSDARLKDDINYDMRKYEKFFQLLRPANYGLKAAKDGRSHLGFIAQDVELALQASGLTESDFAGILLMPETGTYTLRYGEFISLNTYMIQQLLARIDELECRLEG